MNDAACVPASRSNAGAGPQSPAFASHVPRCLVPVRIMQTPQIRKTPAAPVPMKPSVALTVHRTAIRRIVEAHRARNARVFGSVLHGNHHEGSDLDLLIDPTPETTLMDIGAIRHELLQLLGVPVDVVTPKALPARFREAVIAEAVPL
jgi:predicted nucleotidyltransferase